MKAAFVKMIGNGPINHIATASLTVADTVCSPSRIARYANAAHVTNGSGLLRAIARSSPLPPVCRQISG